MKTLLLLKPIPRFARVVSVLTVLVLGLPAVTEAATNSWKTPVSTIPTNFDATGNWAGGVVPGAADTALFTNALTGNVYIKWTAPAINDTVIVNYTNAGSNRAFVLTNVDWTVNTRFAITPSVVGRSNVLQLFTGTLSVTNSSRTAVMELAGPTYGHAQFSRLLKNASSSDFF